MDITEHIDDWGAKRIRKKNGDWTGPIVCDSERITMLSNGGPAWSLTWWQVQKVTALRKPGLLSDTLTLVLETGDLKNVGLVSEAISGWRDFVQAIPEQLSGAMPYTEWAVRVLARGREGSLVVFARKGSAMIGTWSGW